jgi:hypothetical protein
VQAGRVSMEEALRAATHPHDFKLLVSSDGQRSTSVENVMGNDPQDDVPGIDGNGNGNGSLAGAPGTGTQYPGY